MIKHIVKISLGNSKRLLENCKKVLVTKFLPQPVDI